MKNIQWISKGLAEALALFLLALYILQSLLSSLALHWSQRSEDGSTEVF